MIQLPRGFPENAFGIVQIVTGDDDDREFDEDLCRTIINYVGIYGGNTDNPVILQCLKDNDLFPSAITEFSDLVEDYDVLTTMTLVEWGVYMERINKIRNALR